MLLLVATTLLPAAELGPANASRRIERLFVSEVANDATTVPSYAQAEDEAFLARAWLDVVGQRPAPEEVTAFVLDPSPGKRQQMIRRLLDDERYGVNWARYWRDAILYRRNDERALLASRSAVDWLSDQLNANVGWDETARALVTASGSIAEHGETVLLAAQWGNTEDTTSEVSRVLMGVQIQCAQCHDHKTDRWQRNEFHELAAFFPRVRLRAIRADGKRRGFEVVAFDRAPAANAQANNPQRRVEHRMPDLDNPEAAGELMTPKFFLTGASIPTGTLDAERRETLADWITAEDNPWFARALVNRIWAELLGRGLYEPIDDIGPDRDCLAPQTMEFLAGEFIQHDYDLKWLMRTIMNTPMYGRAADVPLTPGESSSLDAAAPRLRADQLFSNVFLALDIDEPAAPEQKDAPGPRALQRNPRLQFNLSQGFDPSMPEDDLSVGVPQALMMMNSTPIARGISAPRGMVARLTEETSDGPTVDNEAAVVELYLRCLAREPSDGELATCLDYIADVDDRAVALEDVTWALLNSTEFLYRD
ncbi:MAG: DUF1549 domain-containing protein [Pirellulales bacterium]